jgi:predicted ATP-grasp superfamily ATP-dependent carboligase
VIRSVLLIGNYVPSLAVARSLAAASYHVIAGNGGEFDIISRSRACHEVWRHPPISEPGAFLQALGSFVAERPEIEAIVPLQSRYVGLVATERARMPKGPVLVTPEPDVVLTCLDKVALYDLARRVGVPTEPWGIATDLDELMQVASNVGYPCVVRPTSDTKGWLLGERKALICPDAAALRAGFPRWPNDHPALLVQHEAAGLKNSFSFLAQEGRIRALVRVMATRTDRLDGTGFGVEFITLPPHPELAGQTEALVAALGYTGYGTAQFMVSDRGATSLLEINPRLGMSVGWTRHLGIDLPLGAVQLARQGGEWHPPDGWTCPVGRRIVWTSRDLYSLRGSLRRDDIDRHQAVSWLARTTRAFVRADAHMTFDRRDPRPTISLYAHLAKVMIRPPAR